MTTTDPKLWKTVLGSPWYEAGDEPKVDAIIEEMFKKDLGVPMGIVMITCSDASGGITEYMYSASDMTRYGQPSGPGDLDDEL